MARCVLRLLPGVGRAREQLGEYSMWPAAEACVGALIAIFLGLGFRVVCSPQPTSSLVLGMSIWAVGLLGCLAGYLRSRPRGLAVIAATGLPALLLVTLIGLDAIDLVQRLPVHGAWQAEPLALRPCSKPDVEGE
jgi:hypothetical protein